MLQKQQLIIPTEVNYVEEKEEPINEFKNKSSMAKFAMGIRLPDKYKKKQNERKNFREAC